MCVYWDALNKLCSKESRPECCHPVDVEDSTISAEGALRVGGYLLSRFEKCSVTESIKS